MKNYWIHLVLCACFIMGSMGCNDLAEELQDFYDEAPGFCKEMCREEFECEEDQWEDHTSGDYSEQAYSDWERTCVLECAFPCSEGVYITEYDYNDYETEYVDYVSGGTYQSFLSCVWTLQSEYYDCNDDHWVLEDLDEEYCEELDECVQRLGLGWSCEWTEIDNYPYKPSWTCEWDTDGQYMSYGGMDQ